MSGFYNHSRKRKHGHSRDDSLSPEFHAEASWLANSNSITSQTRFPAADSVLFIEAREADILCGQEMTALSLEVHDDSSGAQPGTATASGLIQWQALELEETTWVDRCVSRI